MFRQVTYWLNSGTSLRGFLIGPSVVPSLWINCLAIIEPLDNSKAVVLRLHIELLIIFMYHRIIKIKGSVN